VCGGYIAAGFHGTLGHSDAWNRLDSPNHYTFAVKDEGAAAQLARLHEFFSALPFWRMQPFDGVTGDAVALADPGKVYVVYLPKGGSTSFDLSASKVNSPPVGLTRAWESLTGSLVGWLVHGRRLMRRIPAIGRYC
jgi:hypothetical protein